ncbi:MAG: RNA polymerase sigma factor [Verrucomicrobiia bacterium]
MKTTLEAETVSDAQLVEWSLTGDREAFGRIVERYQSLVCSVTYGATGSLGLSEDIAQETFLTAWRELTKLSDAAKLRAWLCGIARNLVNNSLRRGQREPVQTSEPLDTIHEPVSPEPSPSAQAVSREEEAILWRALKRIPDTYREPLILFYREGQSVQRVATSLELSEDAAKQRLSRGRKLLTEEVAAFVEGTLKRTTPGKAFTLGVLAALPVLTTSAKAAVVGATAAKGSALAKSAGLIGLFNAVLGPVFMFLSLHFGYKLERDSARSPQQREFVLKYFRILVGCIAVFALAVLSLTLGGWPLAQTHPKLFVGLLIGLMVAYIIVVAALTLWMRRRQRKIRQQENADGRPVPVFVPVFEYRSKLSLLGLPLIHIRIRGGLDRGPVKAWIAAGDAAIGVIFAFGAVAIAPISFGGFAVGLLTLGGFAVGLVPFGGFSLGPWALGGFAVGWQAIGGCAVGWSAAEGGVAVARDFAVGGVALARHANDAAAEAFIRNSTFFQNALVVMRYAYWINLVWLLPLALWWWTVRIRGRKGSRSL